MHASHATAPTYKLVLLRHGESEFNAVNKFCGWIDADLTATGEAEALSAGQVLAKEGYTFDIAFSSVLKRAVRTLWSVLRVLDLVWIPVTKDWHLNERHYGGLQGLDKAETAAKYGEDQVLVWRRSYDTPPPAMAADDANHPARDPRYRHANPAHLPTCESLKDTVARVLPFWNDVIAPQILSGKRVLIAAHGNSLRALVKYLDNMSEKDILELNIPTGVPLVYELDTNLKPIKHYYLGDPAAVAARIAAVAAQGKAKPK